MSQAASILEEHLEKHDIAGLMARSAALRGELWGPLCRIVLAVRDARDVEGDKIKWNDLPLGDVRAKVTLDDLRAWLAPEGASAKEQRPYQAVQKLASLFDVLDMDPPLPVVPYPQTVTLAELVALAGEVAPVYLPALLPSPHFHVRQRLFDLHVLAGEALGIGHALAKDSLSGLVAGQLKHGTLEAIGAYLRDGTEHLHPQDLTELGARLPADPPAWISEAYARACLVAVERTKNFRSYELTIQTRALTAPQIEACLLAARRKSALFSLVAAYVALQGRPQGAAALAAVIGDKKFGAEAARWLASMGAMGRAAAAARAEEKRVKPLLSAIAALPDAPSVFAGYQLQMPRFGLDVSRFLIKTPAAGEVRVAAATPLLDLEKALNAPLVQEALSPSGWADALQIISLDNRLAAIPFAHARALAAGLLGRGADEASLVAALDRLDWCANVTRQWSGNKAHLGHILLWAGASERVFLHAVARFYLLPGTKTVGTYDEKFANALGAIKPPWAAEVKALLTFLEFDQHQRPPFLGRPPVVASLPADAARGSSAELAGAFGDLWVFGEARGATTIEVTARGTAKLEIDVPSQRWKVSGLRRKGGEGITIPLRDGAVAFALEMHKDRLLVGVGGALVASTFEGLPLLPGPVRVQCAGVGAEVTSLVAYEKHALTLADHACGLLDKPDNVEAIEEVRALESRGAAFTLAIVASLSGKSGGGAAREALQGMGEIAADFRVALGIDEAAPGPRFLRRSFAEVCKSFAALSPKKKLRKGEVHGREAVSFGDLESPTPKRGEAVPSPTLYLSTDGMIHEPVELVDSLAGLPALTKGWGQSARVSAAVSPDEYLLVALEITPPEYDDDALFYECLGAIWPVDEGHVLAVWNTDRKGLAQVMGMRALPTELEWNDLDDEIMVGE